MNIRYTPLLMAPLYLANMLVASENGQVPQATGADLRRPIVTVVHLWRGDEVNVKRSQTEQNAEMNPTLEESLRKIRGWQEVPSVHPVPLLVTNRRVMSARITGIIDDGTIRVMVGDGFEPEKTGKEFSLHPENRRIKLVDFGLGDSIAMRIGWGDMPPPRVYARAVVVRRKRNGPRKNIPDDLPSWMTDILSDKNEYSFVSEIGNGGWIRLAADPVEIGHTSVYGNESPVLAGLGRYKKNGSIEAAAWMPMIPDDLTKDNEENVHPLINRFVLTPEYPVTEKQKGAYTILRPYGLHDARQPHVYTGEAVIVFVRLDHTSPVINSSKSLAEQTPSGDVLKAAPEE